MHDYVSSYWFQHVRQCLSSGSMTIIQQLGHFVDVRWNKSFPLSEEPRIRLPPEIEKVASSLSDQLLWKLKHVAGWEWRSKSKVCGNEEVCPLTLHETARRLQSRFDHLVTSKCNSDCNEYTSCKELHQIYGKRLFHCSTLGCSSAFQDQRTRDCHFLTHRPFYCDVVHCDYNVLGFGTRDELCQHQADVHKSQIGGGEPLLCDWTFLDTVMKRRLLSSAIRKGELALVKSLLLLHAQGVMLQFSTFIV